MFLGYKLLSFAQEKLLFNNLQYNLKITLTPCYWNEIIVLWSVNIEPEIKHIMISQQLWNWNFHLCLITSGTVLFKHAILVDVYSLTMEGIFLKPPPPLISSRFLSTRGVGRSNWKSGGSKICDPPLPTLYPFTRAAQKLMTNPLSALAHPLPHTSTYWPVP